MTKRSLRKTNEKKNISCERSEHGKSLFARFSQRNHVSNPILSKLNCVKIVAVKNSITFAYQSFSMYLHE